MKILMFGRGVIASTYGWALEQGGHEVEFYVRPGRAAEYGDRIELDLLDLRRHPWGERVVRSWSARLREDLPLDHDFDLVVVSLPHHRLGDAATFLAPRIGSATVLVLGNVWAEPADAISPLPLEQVAWGFPGAGGGFGRDGVLHALLARSVVLGTLGGTQPDRERTVRRILREAGFRTREQPDLRGWLWLHFAADAGLHAQALRIGTLADLIGATRALREALLTTRELLPLLQARGVDLRRHRRTVLLYRAPTWLTAPTLSWLTRHVTAARISLEAHNDPTAPEPRAVYRDALESTRTHHIVAPRLEAAETHRAHQHPRPGSSGAPPVEDRRRRSDVRLGSSSRHSPAGHGEPCR